MRYAALAALLLPTLAEAGVGVDEIRLFARGRQRAGYWQAVKVKLRTDEAVEGLLVLKVAATRFVAPLRMNAHSETERVLPFFAPYAMAPVRISFESPRGTVVFRDASSQLQRHLMVRDGPLCGVCGASAEGETAQVDFDFPPSEALLRQFDALLLDISAWRNMSADWRETLTTFANDGGLLIVVGARERRESRGAGLLLFTPKFTDAERAALRKRMEHTRERFLGRPERPDRYKATRLLWPVLLLLAGVAAALLALTWRLQRAALRVAVALAAPAALCAAALADPPPQAWLVTGEVRMSVDDRGYLFRYAAVGSWSDGRVNLENENLKYLVPRQIDRGSPYAAAAEYRDAKPLWIETGKNGALLVSTRPTAPSRLVRAQFRVHGLRGEMYNKKLWRGQVLRRVRDASGLEVERWLRAGRWRIRIEGEARWRRSEELLTGRMPTLEIVAGDARD